MKLRLVTNALFVLSLVFLFACTKATSPTSVMEDAHSEKVIFEKTLPQGNGSQNVTGHFEWDFSSGYEKASFTAVRHKSGMVSGQFQFSDVFNDGTETITGHGEVTCFSVDEDGKTAFLGGIVTQGSYAGTKAAWSVIDNGEGTKSPTDITTDFGFGWPLAAGENDRNCDECHRVSWISPLNGNIQVKP